MRGTELTRKIHATHSRRGSQIRECDSIGEMVIHVFEDALQARHWGRVDGPAFLSAGGADSFSSGTKEGRWSRHSHGIPLCWDQEF